MRPEELPLLENIELQACMDSSCMLEVIVELIGSAVKRSEAVAELKKINRASLHKSAEEGLKLVSQAVSQRYFCYDNRPNFNIKWGAYFEENKLYELKQKPKKVEEPPKPQPEEPVEEEKKKRGRTKAKNPNVLENLRR